METQTESVLEKATKSLYIIDIAKLFDQTVQLSGAEWTFGCQVDGEERDTAAAAAMGAYSSTLAHILGIPEEFVKRSMPVELKLKADYVSVRLQQSENPGRLVPCNFGSLDLWYRSHVLDAHIMKIKKNGVDERKGKPRQMRYEALYEPRELTDKGTVPLMSGKIFGLETCWNSPARKSIYSIKEAFDALPDGK